MLKEWLDLYKIMAYDNVVVNPERFIKYLQNIASIKNYEIFTGFEQNDSVEFFHFMIDCFHESLKNVDSKMKYPYRGSNEKFRKYIKKSLTKNMSIVQSCMSGYYRSQIMRKKDGEVLSENYEHFYMIHIPLFEFSVSSLSECLHKYFEEETLEDENAYFYEKENKKIDVIKNTRIIHFPEYLTIHLKRWNYNLRKNSKRIEYETVLDLSEYSCDDSETCKYELFGIINHTGNVFGGHYYSCVKKSDDHWYCMNDKSIKRIKESKLISSSNYCLFYRKIK